MRVTLPESLVASGRYEEFAQGPGKRHGRSNSLKWPWLYDKLRAKGYDKSKAAAISNSRLRYRKKGRISVLPAKAAHNPKVLKRLAEADRSGKHATKGKLTKGLRASALREEFMDTIAFACHSKACAPPPVGAGGSKGRTGNAARRPPIKGTFVDHDNATAHRAPNRSGVLDNARHPIITASEARGDSRPVSREEFQRLATRGQEQLDAFKKNASPTTGLDDDANWAKLKNDTWNEVQKEWGGATIDSHTGQALPQGANKYAITVKDRGLDTMSIRIDASRDEFDAMMDQAKNEFGDVLAREKHHLGVFRDDDMGRIDFDPVLVVEKRADVDTIGAASRSIGGAYNFSDGNGYWPPHVAEGR